MAKADSKRVEAEVSSIVSKVGALMLGRKGPVLLTVGTLSTAHLDKLVEALREEGYRPEVEEKALVGTHSKGTIEFDTVSGIRVYPKKESR